MQPRVPRARRHRQGVYDALTGDGNSYGFTTELADRTLEKLKKGEELTAEEDTFARELNAHMSAEALGTESFMKKLVKGKPKLAEKLIARIKALQAALSKSETPEARTQRKRLAKAEKLWLRAVEEAGAKEKMKYFGANKEEEEKGSEDATRMNSEKMHDTEESGVQFSLPIGDEIVDARSVTESDVRTLLENAYKKDYRDGSYIPLRVNTPSILIDAVTNFGKHIDNLPIIISVKKARQLMYSQEDWIRDGMTGSAHDFTTDDVINLIKAMDSPKQIIYQSADERFVEIVEFETNQKQKAVAVLEIGENKNPKYLNGYNGGFYQVLVTAFEPDTGYVENLLSKDGNIRIYPKKKKGSPQRGSGNRVPSHLNESPFANSIPALAEKINPSEQNSSEKVSTSGKTQFSLPSKPQSAGARAKSNANRSRSKTFTREDAALIAEAVVDESTVFAGEDGGIYRSKFQGKVKLIDRLWVRLNEIEDQRSRDIYAEKLNQTGLEPMRF